MPDELRLRDYYELELNYLRQMGVEFAEKHPKIASRLALEPNKCEDPHVERMIEAFAFLAARVHAKIDDEFPEITTALLTILYPHYLRPVPSMSVVQFHLDPDKGKLSTQVRVPRQSMLYSKPVNGVACKFQTCYETAIWPVSVADAQWTTPDRLQPAIRAPEAVAALRIDLRCAPDVTFDKLGLSSLRLYLDGEGRLVHDLYELLCNNTARILARDPTKGAKTQSLELPPGSLRPVGFTEDEAVLPYPSRSFAGYRLLQEYFNFPEKFFFLDLCNLETLASAGFKDRAELLALVSRFELRDRHERLETGISAKTLKLGCTPIVNLFPQTAEPILLEERKYEYEIIPDVRRRFATEIFSVDEVVSSSTQSSEVFHFEPFYSFRHGARHNKGQTFWHAVRRPTETGGEEADVFLSLVDMSGRPSRPGVDALTVRCTCTNRDLPSRLPFESQAGAFEIEGMPSIERVQVLVKPTPQLEPPAGKHALWRLISHLSLNYLSLVDDGGTEALQEILRLYNFSNEPELERQIAGLVKVRSERHVAPVISEHGISAARGIRVEIELDEEQFTGSGVYLFASVLERFLGFYVSMNSFSQLVAKTTQRKEILGEWLPRSGQTLLI